MFNMIRFVWSIQLNFGLHFVVYFQLSLSNFLKNHVSLSYITKFFDMEHVLSPLWQTLLFGPLVQLHYLIYFRHPQDYNNFCKYPNVARLHSRWYLHNVMVFKSIMILSQWNTGSMLVCKCFHCNIICHPQVFMLMMVT